MAWIWLLLGIDRLAFGGGIRSGLRTTATVFAIFIAVGATWGQPWTQNVANALGLLLLMTLPHGPMLTLPIGPRKTGSPDPLYPLVAWVRNDDLRWWAFSLLRYPGVATVWAAGLALTGAAVWWAPIAAACWVPILSRATWPLRFRLPTIGVPGDEAENWTELVGWTLMGATLAVL